MSGLTVIVPTDGKSMRELRPALEQALDDLLPGARLESRWQDDVLHVHGSAFRGTLRLSDGRLRSDVRLRPPLTFFRSTIESRLTRALEEVASG